MNITSFGVGFSCLRGCTLAQWNVCLISLFSKASREPRALMVVTSVRTSRIWVNSDNPMLCALSDIDSASRYLLGNGRFSGWGLDLLNSSSMYSSSSCEVKNKTSFSNCRTVGQVMNSDEKSSDRDIKGRFTANFIVIFSWIRRFRIYLLKLKII